MTPDYLQHPPAESRILRVGGLDTHYLEAGSGPATIVLVHGGGAGADALGNWAPVIDRLKDMARVVAVDMIGFGRSAKPEGDGNWYSQPGRAEHLAAFMDALGIEEASVVGNSMGGATALGVAARRPDLVNTLVLMGSAGLPIPPSAALGTLMSYDFTPEGMHRVVQALTWSGYPISDAMVRYRWELSVSPGTREALLRINGWIKDNGGLLVDVDAIRSIRCRTLVVSGKDDQVVPVENAYKFLSMIDNSWGHIIPHCGHWPMIEYPDDFARLLGSFVFKQ